MQYPFSCLPHVFANIEKTMSSARLARYLPAANNDKHLALRLYVWNARLCEEFYLPLQMVEVSFRNGINRRLQTVFQQNWPSEQRLKAILPNRHKDELAEVIGSEKAKRGAGLTVDHIVAGLSFGFWLHLMTTGPRHVLWKYGYKEAFPQIPSTISREDLYDRLDKFRRFRNSVMHHYAIFDKNPTSEWQNIQLLSGWMCPESHWLLRELSNPAAALQRRPTI